MKIAALITCFNRKTKTLDCLKSLFEINSDLDVYLVDDCSTDGTSVAVKSFFPNVKIIQGDGSLFWSRGMYTAWKEAIINDYDYYLWLNDDIIIYPSALEELFICSEQNKDSIISGLVEDKNKEEILYGGYDIYKKIIKQSDSSQQIIYMNGNIVLIPKKIVKSIGIIDPIFQHDLGDIDYGLRAQKAGYYVYSTRIAIASGYKNDSCRVRMWGTTVKNRFKKLYTPLGSPPNINFYFRKKHFGLFNACLYWLYLIFINILSDDLVHFIWGDRYMNK